jgi:hypothetical protein
MLTSLQRFKNPGGPVIFLLLAVIVFGCGKTDSATSSFFTTRGVVLSVEDLRSLDWPERAKESGLTTIATHVTPGQVAAFIQSEKGQEFLKKCHALGLEVEHELHAMNDLLPRTLFEKDSMMFRMNKEGRRVADFNLCVHSERAVETVCNNAVKYAVLLKPTTGRYFYWIDDGRPMCHCSKCILYSDSEQALILENSIIKALKTVDPDATLAHLAYLNTLPPPVKIKPEAGIFLEFAPIQRSWAQPLCNESASVVRTDSLVRTNADLLKLLDGNLEVFGKQNAQILEYWLDVSLFSQWRKPAKQLPWNNEVFLNDIDVYAKRGIKHITSFAVYIDEIYLKTYRDISFINEYGAGLESYEGND